MNMRIYVAFVVTCLAITMGWMAGCGSKSSQSPTEPTVGIGPPIVTVLTITGNGSLTAPGQTIQVSAAATFSDGSKKDVTSTAQWFSTSRSVVTVSPGGLVTAVDYGKTEIWAYQTPSPRSNILTITVLPEGTYILSGNVSESGNLSVSDARIELIGGPMSGRVAVTDQFGRYTFNGVAGVQQVRATKAGYVAATQSVPQDTEHVNLELTPTVPYAAIGGVYRLTFKAAESCQLPDDAVSRTYTATIAETGARLTITLSDAQFSASGNLIDGRVYGNTVSLMLNSDYYCRYGPNCVAEKLADMRYLTLIGTAAGTVTGATISTVFAGSVSVAATTTNRSPIATCAAPDHQLVFTRTATTTLSKRF